MFLSANSIIAAIMGIPFAIMVLIPLLIAIIYFIYLTIQTIKYRSLLGIRDIQDLFVEETNQIPDYEPAVMGYLVNYQRIGRREICSTLFDLISRGVVKITLKSGFVSDDNSTYVLIKNEDKMVGLKPYEERLIKYLFHTSSKITSATMNKRLYKKNLNENFFETFLKGIQADAKKYDFFSAKVARVKVRVYKVINKVVTVMATVTSGLSAFVLAGLEGLGDIADSGESLAVILLIFAYCLVTAGLLWVLKFLISFMYNLSCYYNDLSKSGKEDYKKWIGFRKFLKKCSTLTDHPLMGVMVWERYYAYAIGLKCSKKFFKQIKKMKIMDNTVDVKTIECLDNIASCIGTSKRKIKSISVDKYGGSHVDY